METNIVSVKYEDKHDPGTFTGKEYSYFTDAKLEVGDLVQTPTAFGTNIALVTKINVPREPLLDTYAKSSRQKKYNSNS